jgi:putative transposase
VDDDGTALFSPRLRPTACRVFVAPAANRIWIGDFPAIATWSGRLYLAVLLDLYSRRVIGWAMSANPDLHMVIEVLHMALMLRRPHQGLIHHTDQGATYQHRLTEHVCCEYESKGNCYV